MAGRSYTQNFFKVQYIIIQPILGRKSMKKKIIVTDKKYSLAIRLLSMKGNVHTDLRTFHAQLLRKGSQYREEDSENKIVINRVHYR